MVNIIFITALATAADVYEICVHRKQTWNERQQQFDTTNVNSYFSRDKLQFIIYEELFEVNRDKRQISSTFKKDGMDCWREHENSFFCYDKKEDDILWEFTLRSGVVTRDILEVCLKNGKET